MRLGETAFVDSGAWIALALGRGPLHVRARETWYELVRTGARICTSIPVVLETFTFLDRNALREVALDWKDSLEDLVNLTILNCAQEDLAEAWTFFQRPDLHKLSAVDATSFVIMRRHGIRRAFTFDHHFSMAGFEVVG